MKHFSGSSKHNIRKFLTTPIEDDVKKSELKIYAALAEHKVMVFIRYYFKIIS